MNSATMTPEHAKQIGEALRPGLHYLSRLRERMTQVGFRPDDPLMAAVVKTHDASRDLSMAMHYAGCGGVGAARIGQ
jgi:hypothetical protein